jgi:hypothetical protein
MADVDDCEWLLDKADPALAFQVQRDMLGADDKKLWDLQNRIARNGIGGTLLEKRKSDGHWGNGVYNPKWTCTHYVLFELVQLGIAPDIRECGESASLLLGFPIGKDGGINYARTVEYSDVCINGMILNIVSYFGIVDSRVKAVVDFLLSVQMEDGGWNCEYCHGARMRDALSIIMAGLSRRGFVGSSSQPGKVYPDVKSLTDARKWNTLRALRVAKKYGAYLP